MNSVRSAAVGLLVLMALAAVAPSVAAHGGGTPRLTDAEAGPYRVYVWTDPEPWRAGEVHLTIAVTLPPPPDAVIDENLMGNTLDEPVDDATVTVRLTPADGGAPLELEATVLDSLGGAYYETDTELPAAGPWQTDIAVIGPLGQGAVGFAIEALPARSVNWLWFALAGLGLLGIAAAFGMRSGKHASAQTPARVVDAT